MLDRLAQLHSVQFRDLGDPEINERVAQYEMAYRMQTSVPEVMDISRSRQRFRELRRRREKPGTFAANCLLARRLAERNVRSYSFTILAGPSRHPAQRHHASSQGRGQACYALVTDLKQRGLLDDTLVVWAVNSVETNYSQGKLTKDDYGRDHHPRCFTVWLAGGGIQPASPTARQMNSATTSRKTLSTCMTCRQQSYNSLAGPHSPDFPFPGPRLSINRCAGELVNGILA